MNVFKVVAVSLATLMALDLASAFVVSPPVPPTFGIGGPFFPGLMMGGLGFGGLGFGGLGGLGALGAFGPLGLLGGPLGLGFGLGSFGPFGNARLGGIRGRRDVSTHHVGHKNHADIKCTLSTKLINCTGPNEIYQCHVESFLTVPKERKHVGMFEFTFKDKMVNKAEVIKVVPKRITQRLGHKFEHVSIYADPKLTETEPGFLIRDIACFSEIFSLAQELAGNITVRFNL